MKKMMMLLVALLVGAVGMGGVVFAAGDHSNVRTDHVAMPNGVANTLTVPSGWGAWGNTIFAGAGLTSPQAYSDKDDGVAGVGFGVGDPVENLGLQVSLSVNDLSEQNNLSYGAVLHRYIGLGTSVAVGGEHLFRDKNKSDVGETYYLVLGYACQNIPSRSEGASGLHGSIGVGGGRFAHKSPSDVLDGKGEGGTYVFGALAYEVFTRTNLILEWNGLNLNAGIGILPFKHFPIGLTFGAADLTSNTGDGVRFISSLGLAYKFN